MGQAEKSFSTFTKSLVEGHYVFADRYYTTAKLIDLLSSKKCYYTGILNIYRKNFTPYLKTFKFSNKKSK